MSMEHFIERLSQKSVYTYRGKDQIPGTDKVRTYCGNSSLYSRESSLEKIGSKQYHPNFLKK